MKKTNKPIILIIIVLILVALLVACTPNGGNDEYQECDHQSKTNCVCDFCGVVVHDVVDCVCLNCGETSHSFDEFCKCSKCGYENHQVENCFCKICKSTVHTPNEDCQCTECNSVAHQVDEHCYCDNCEEYHHIPNGLYCRHGDKLYYGYYPQSQIVDTLLVMSICATTGLLENEPSTYNGWTSYGYYSNGIKGDYALYKDVELYGEKYRATYTTKYRPHASELAGNQANSTMDNVGVRLEQVFLFRYEPIEWKVLEDNDGSMLIQSVNILDNQAFQDMPKNEYEQKYGTQSGISWHDNWKNSTLRGWLNGHFYDSSFDYYDKKLALKQTMNNESADQENTTEIVSLLDEDQILNYYKSNTSRVKTATQYALAQGYGMSNWDENSIQGDYQFEGCWSVRIAKETLPNNYERRFVSNLGNLFSDSWYYDAYEIYGVDEYLIKSQLGGVAPVMRIGKFIERVAEKEYKLNIKDDDGNPLSGVRVKFSSEEEVLGSYQTDEKGSITVFAPDKQVISLLIENVSGDYSYKSSYKFASKQYALDLVFGLRRDYTVSITDRFGDLIGGAKVKLSDGLTESAEFATNEQGVVTIREGFQTKNVYATITGFNKKIYLWNESLINKPGNDRYEKYYFDENREVSILLKDSYPYNGYEVGDNISSETFPVENYINSTKSYDELLGGRDLLVMVFYWYFDDAQLEMLKAFDAVYEETPSVAVYALDAEYLFPALTIDQWMSNNGISYDYGCGSYGLYYSLSQRVADDYPLLVVLDADGNILAFHTETITTKAGVQSWLNEYLVS